MFYFDKLSIILKNAAKVELKLTLNYNKIRKLVNDGIAFTNDVTLET